MPTAIGIIFFCCGAYCFFRRESWLLPLLFVSIAFEASSAFNIAERGIEPYYVVAMWIILRAIANRTLGRRSGRKMPHGGWLLSFGLISVCSAFLYPFIFSGTPVYDPKIGIDPGLFIHPPLHFGINNLAQAGFLACHIVTLYALLELNFSVKKVLRAYTYAFYIVAGVVMLQCIFQLCHLPFPYSLFLNNPGRITGKAANDFAVGRDPGTFMEPSLAGGFLLLYCVGFMREYLAGRGKTARVLLALVAIGVVTSSGSLFLLFFFIAILICKDSPLRFPWYLRVDRIRRIAWILSLLITPVLLAVAVSPSYRDIFLEMTVSKGDSGSFYDRTASDLFALQLCSKTYGIGVGMGSNRASSMLTTQLSTVGLAGFLTFAIYVGRLLRSLPKRYSWLRWATFALVLNMYLDIADVTMPMLWMPIYLAVAIQTESALPPGKTCTTNLALAHA